MKHFTKLVFAALCICISVSSHAQKPSSQKTFLFNNYPAVINCTEAQLSNLFAADKGQAINLSLPGNLALKGAVAGKMSKYNNLETITIQLPAFKNILFSVTRRLDGANKMVYAGHLFSSNYADGYELKRKPDNTYQLIKIDMEELLPACNQ